MHRNAGRRGLSTALLFVVAALVLMHAAMLWQRLDDRSIARPEVAMRWIAAAAIAGAALLLRRVSTGSRAWVVFWLTVALLHLAGPAGAVLTQAVLTTTPLLLLFVAIAIGVACGTALFIGGRNGRVTCTPVVAPARDRAPPSR